MLMLRWVAVSYVWCTMVTQYPYHGNQCTMVTQHRYHGNMSDVQMKSIVGEVLFNFSL